MLGKIKKAGLVGLLSTQLVVGCTHAPTISKPAYAPLLAAKPLTPEALAKIKEASPKDTVFADLLQAFALMRTADLQDLSKRREILDLLSTSVDSFEDLRDPVNFSKAFSADEDKDFRGRPHERMFASIMAGVFHMAENNCSMALPFLRNAEFLDARFQKLPFGTDAPLVYALMYRCLKQEKSSPDDIKRAADGIFRSVRFLSLQEPLIEALVAMDEVDMRVTSISRKMAYMLYEISIYHSLISAPNDLDLSSLLDDAAKNASIFLGSIDSHFEDEYKSRLSPLVAELAKVYGLSKKTGSAHLKDLVFAQVNSEIKQIGQTLAQVLAKHPDFKTKTNQALLQSDDIYQKIIHAASAPKMRLSFEGMGPNLVRLGSYDEISLVKMSPTANRHAAIRQKNLPMYDECGMHRAKEGGFSVVLCAQKPAITSTEKPVLMPALELLSLSRKAMSTGGRKFDKVLHGRAQFKAATENIAEVAAWSAFFLFYIGTAMIEDCRSKNASQACYAAGFTLWGIAGITVLFSGTIWLIGLSSNPAADSRFLHLMYESTWMAI